MPGASAEPPDAEVHLVLEVSPGAWQTAAFDLTADSFQRDSCPVTTCCVTLFLGGARVLAIGRELPPRRPFHPSQHPPHVLDDQPARSLVASDIGSDLLRLQQSLRIYDFLGRYGGEEFLIVLPGCDADTASLVAERLRGSISERPFMLRETSLRVTISVGMTLVAPDGQMNLPIHLPVWPWPMMRS